MSKDGYYLVVYDVENNRERRRVSRVLEGFGFRVQKSVFECRINRSLQTRLTKKLQALAIETGCILIYRLTKPLKREKIGACHKVPDDETYAYVI